MERPMRARVTHLEEFVAKMFHLEKASAAVDAVDQQEEIPWRSVIIRVENGSDIYTTYTARDFNLPHPLQYVSSRCWFVRSLEGSSVVFSVVRRPPVLIFTQNLIKCLIYVYIKKIPTLSPRSTLTNMFYEIVLSQQTRISTESGISLNVHSQFAPT